MCHSHLGVLGVIARFVLSVTRFRIKFEECKSLGLSSWVDGLGWIPFSEVELSGFICRVVACSAVTCKLQYPTPGALALAA